MLRLTKARGYNRDVPVQLTRSDAWLLAAIASRRGQWIGLTDLIDEADWLNRLILSFDEVAFGVPRLQLAGYVETKGLAASTSFRTTGAGQDLVDRASANAGTLGDVLGAMDAAVDARPYPQPEQEDRTAGRLSGLDRETFEGAVAENARSFREAARTVLGIDIDDPIP